MQEKVLEIILYILTTPIYATFYILFIQLMIIVKVHRVFPSNHKYSVSSRKSQFHRANLGDSRGVVTPFVQVGTYPTRNFATLGPSGIQPPFAKVYVPRIKRSNFTF